MSFISQKHFPRRAFLRGAGATLALPFLDAMVPAGRTSALAAATDQTRLICIEEVHGLAGCNNWGASKFLFAPEQTGKGGVHRVTISGHPNLSVSVHGTEPGEPGAAGGGNATAANRIVNAIPAVCAAPAGPLSPLDLPPNSGSAQLRTS